jgi:hypothetical protein
MVQAAGGQELVLKYKDGSQKFSCRWHALVTAVPPTASFLKTGEVRFLNANARPTAR